MKRLRTFTSSQIFKNKIKKSKTYSGWCPFLRPIQWYYSQADPIWPDGTFKSSEPLHTKIYLILLLVGITVCIDSFLPTGWRTFIWWKSAKVLQYSGLDCGMLELLQIFFSQAVIQRPNVDFWRPVRRKRLRFVTIQPVIPTSRRIRCIFVWSGSKLWSLLKIARSKLKNQKPIAVDVLFQAYPMVPLSCRFNLAGRYL